MKSGGSMSLAFRAGSGLWLVWPMRGDNRVGDAGSARVLLSPWVVDAQVLRYGSKEDKWELESQGTPEASDWRVLRLELSHAGHRRVLLIPCETRRVQGSVR